MGMITNMAATAARQFTRIGISSKSIFEGLKCSKKCASSSQLLNMVKAKTTSNALKARCLAQFLPSLLQIQAANNFVITSAVSSMLDSGFLSKSNALRIAINEAEVNSTEETDEDDDATLYILSEMFTILCVHND